MELPLVRAAVDHIDWQVPPGTGSVNIRLSGHFSQDSTVVFWAHQHGWSAINMNRPRVSSNALAGQDNGELPIWVQGNVSGYDIIRVQCSRLAPGDWIEVQFWTHTSDAGPNLRGVLNGMDSPYQIRPVSPSYVIAEEPDDVVDYLRERADP